MPKKNTLPLKAAFVVNFSTSLGDEYMNKKIICYNWDVFQILSMKQLLVPINNAVIKSNEQWVASIPCNWPMVKCILAFHWSLLLYDVIFYRHRKLLQNEFLFEIVCPSPWFSYCCKKCALIQKPRTLFFTTFFHCYVLYHYF